MPFTTSHPAIVLPLKQIWPKWFSLTGLIAGAMAPDLPYFLLSITTYRGISHSWAGLFIVCFPAAIVFSFVFHRLFKYDAIVNLPKPFDVKFSGLAVSEFKLRDWQGWLIFIFSILIGILSHFFWDSFTHPTGEIARMFPLLTENTTIFGITRSYARFLQHISTIVGGVAVLIFFFKSRLVPSPAFYKSVRKPNKKLLFWVMCGSFALIFAVAAVCFYNNFYDWQIENGYNRNLVWMSFGIGNWAGLFYIICLYSIVKKITKRK